MNTKPARYTRPDGTVRLLSREADGRARISKADGSLAGYFLTTRAAQGALRSNGFRRTV